MFKKGFLVIFLAICLVGMAAPQALASQETTTYHPMLPPVSNFRVEQDQTNSDVIITNDPADMDTPMYLITRDGKKETRYFSSTIPRFVDKETVLGETYSYNIRAVSNDRLTASSKTETITIISRKKTRLVSSLVTSSQRLEASMDIIGLEISQDKKEISYYLSGYLVWNNPNDLIISVGFQDNAGRVFPATILNIHIWEQRPDPKYPVRISIKEGEFLLHLPTPQEYQLRVTVVNDPTKLIVFERTEPDEATRNRFLSDH